MEKFDKYDVMMKMLEIIELDMDKEQFITIIYLVEEKTTGNGKKGKNSFNGAIEKTRKAIHEILTFNISKESMREVSQQDYVKSFIKTTGKRLSVIIRNMESIPKTLLLIWSIIEHVWK